MRLYEITEKNISWAAYAGVDFDIVKNLELFISMSKKMDRMGSTRIAGFVNAADEYIERLQKSLNTNFPNPRDPDIVDFKNKIDNGIKELNVGLDKLRGQI